MLQRKRKAALGFIFITLLLDIIGFGIIIPIIPKLIQSLMNCGTSQAAMIGGWLMFTYAIVQFISAPIIGNLSDQYGRRSVLLVTLFGFGIDYLFLAYAPSIEWLFLGRIVSGATGASITTASAYISDISTPEKRAQNFGMIGAAFGLGFIIGPVLGGQLAILGLKAPFIGAACLSLLNWLYGLFVLPESLSLENRRKFDWKRANPIGSFRALTKTKEVSWLVAALVLINVASHAVQSIWGYYTMEKFNWDANMVGNSLGVVGICVMFVQGFLIRKAVPKLGHDNCIYLGLSFYIIGFVLFALAANTWTMFAFTFVYCLGGLAMPSMQGKIAGTVPAWEQGEIQGALTGIVSATSIVGPVLMSNVFSFFTHRDGRYFPGAPFILAALLTLIGLLMTIKAIRQTAR